MLFGLAAQLLEGLVHQRVHTASLVEGAGSQPLVQIGRKPNLEDTLPFGGGPLLLNRS